MKAIVYDITISDGVLDIVHGYSYSIKELYVPDLGIVANMGGHQGQMFVFKDKTRVKEGKFVKEITITKAFANRLLRTLRDKTLEKELSEVLK
jgi:hypothetical protein